MSQSQGRLSLPKREVAEISKSGGLNDMEWSTNGIGPFVSCVRKVLFVEGLQLNVIMRAITAGFLAKAKMNKRTYLVWDKKTKLTNQFFCQVC